MTGSGRLRSVTPADNAWRRRSTGRVVSAGFVRSLCRVAVVASLIAVSGPVLGADDGERCLPLTFRWTSGPGIGRDAIRPPAEALQNPPFLTDPKIVSVTPFKWWLGDSVKVKLAPEAVEVLSVETGKHIREQLLIMLGDELVFAPVVRERLGRDEMVLSGAQPNRMLDQWQSIQQQQRRCKP